MECEGFADVSHSRFWTVVSSDGIFIGLCLLFPFELLHFEVLFPKKSLFPPFPYYKTISFSGTTLYYWKETFVF